MNFSFLMSISKIREFTNLSINSTLNQSYNGEYEIFIINDGIKISEFNYYLEKNFKNNKNYKFIKSYSNPKNLGLTKSLNIALNFCSGNFIIRIDDDDICKFNRLKELSNIIDQNNKIKIIASSYELIDKNNNIKKKVNISKVKFYKKYKYKNILAHSSLCFKKKYILEIGGYNEKFLTSQDFEIINRVKSFNKNNIYFFEKTLVQIRIHDKSISKLNSYYQRQNSIKICLASNFTKYYDLIVNSDFDKLNNIVEEINTRNISEYLDALSFCYLYDNSDKSHIKNLTVLKFVIKIYIYNYQLFLKRVFFKFINY